ncbi:MAG TPA: alpha/beta hydrolase [Opitutaceae bacterium]
MNPFRRCLSGLLLLNVSALAFAADPPAVVPLWPGAAPGSEKLTITEKITERGTDPAKHDRIYTQIVQPALAVHRPASPNGVAVIVALGGAYQRVVIDKEGNDTAAWLNSLGVTAFVLKYRLPDEGHENGRDVPLQDAQRAMRLVRANAREWGLDPNRVGFLGYSAGGHLAASVEFFPDRRVYEPVDVADRLRARPDFSILCYASSGAKNPAPATVEGPTPRQQLMWEYRIEAVPDAVYPPTFIFQADDDTAVNPEHAIQLYTTLKQAGTSVELHIFRRGGHGFGIREAKGPIARWPELCAAWLRDIDVLR